MSFLPERLPDLDGLDPLDGAPLDPRAPAPAEPYGIHGIAPPSGVNPETGRWVPPETRYPPSHPAGGPQALVQQFVDLNGLLARLGVQLDAMACAAAQQQHAGGDLWEPTSPEVIRKIARGWNTDEANRLWSGPPLIKLHLRGCVSRGRDPADPATCLYRGCVPFKGALVTTTRRRGTVLGTGGEVELEVGDPFGGGETSTRTFVVGDGFPGYNAIGQYGNANVRLVRAPTTDRAHLTWTDSDSHVGSAENSLLRAPIVVSDGGALAERVVPEGSVEAFFTTAVPTVTWRDYSGAGGAAVALTEATVAGVTIRVRGHTIQTDAACRIQFYLAPL